MIALKALKQVVLMPSKYMSEKEFSCLMKPKTKTQNALTGVDSLMRETLEELIHLQSKKLTAKVQKHPSC